MRIFKKKIEFVSKEELDAGMENVNIILNGMTVASKQQAQMLASIANQLAMIVKTLKPQVDKKEEVHDPSFQ